MTFRYYALEVSINPCDGMSSLEQPAAGSNANVQMQSKNIVPHRSTTVVCVTLISSLGLPLLSSDVRED
jgi:hypothetical protein